MPKGKGDALGKAIMKDKAASIRSKKQQLREKYILGFNTEYLGRDLKKSKQVLFQMQAYLLF